jgi:hypothetical protein
MSLPTKAGMTNLGSNPWSPCKGHGIPFRNYGANAGSADAGAQAAKGNHIRPLVPVIIQSLLIEIFGTSLGTSTIFQGLIGEYNVGTNQLVNITLTDSYTFPGSMASSSQLMAELDFPAPLFMKPNVDYVMAALETSGTDSTALPTMTDYIIPVDFPCVSLGRVVLAKKSPATTDTWTFTAGALHSIGAVGHYFPWGV